MSDSKPKPAPRRLADRISWTGTDSDPELPGVLAVRGPVEPGDRDSLEPVLGVGTDELIARVSQVPSEPLPAADAIHHEDSSDAESE